MSKEQDIAGLHSELVHLDYSMLIQMIYHLRKEQATLKQMLCQANRKEFPYYLTEEEIDATVAKRIQEEPSD